MANRRISFSEEEKSIESIWSWYQDQREALRDFKNKITNSISISSSSVNNKFIALSLEELNDYFNNSEQELEHLVCFDLISATEALLRTDFYKRVYTKDRSDLSRQFRELHKQNGNNIRLEDIIEKWKDFNVTEKLKFSTLLSLLNYRHWLAHGRYWNPKFGRQYSFDVAYDIAEHIFEVVK